jgi:hypothetical protein
MRRPFRSLEEWERGDRGCGISASNGSGVERGSDQRVPHVRGKEGGGAAGLAGLVYWAALAPDWPSRVVSLFFYSDSFLIFCFTFYLLHFGSKLIQTTLQKKIKIQSIKVGQSETSFQNKIRFSVKPYKF